MSSTIGFGFLTATTPNIISGQKFIGHGCRRSASKSPNNNGWPVCVSLSRRMPSAFSIRICLLEKRKKTSPDRFAPSALKASNPHCDSLSATDHGVLIAQQQRGVDQRDVREGLRKISQLSLRFRTVFLRKQSEIVSHIEQPLEQFARLFVTTDQVQTIG